MQFNSLLFIAFFCVTFAIYLGPLPWRGKKFVLLVASYAFYAAWSPPFVVLLWISTVVDWFCARAIAATEIERRQKMFVLISLVTNLGILGVFKYGGFALDNASWILQAWGLDVARPAWDVVLPVGISFYTFQTISYTIDVYRGIIQPSKSFTDFALYVTFFPQLVAGPIVRAGMFLPQLLDQRIVRGKHVGWGLNLFMLGLFQKVAIADGLLAPVVDAVYADPNVVRPDMWSAWLGQFAFSGQIFFDFSGYSNCAIGIAMCMGFELPDNFRSPYAAVGFADFWRRWHISLSTWLRDYVFYSAGGLRRHTQLRALMITMLLAGLWHGAGWTFIVWGTLHGLYIAFDFVIRNFRIAKFRLWGTVGGRFAITLLTFTLVTWIWPLFRGENFADAWSLLIAMVGWSGDEALVSNLHAAVVIAVTAALVTMHIVLRETTLEEFVDRIPAPVLVLVNGVMLACIVMSAGEDRAFIYFQF